MEIEKLDNSEMETLDCYDIDTADVWNYERENLLFLEENNHTLAKTLLNKLKEIIVQREKADFRLEDYDSGDEKFRVYYTRNMQQYLDSFKSLKGQYEIEHFFDNKGSCYSYDCPIIISIGDPDYDFWFTLRLRQYDGKISDIEKYLNYQLKINFNQDNSEFLKFLNLCLRQYSENLSNKVIPTVREWMENEIKLLNNAEEVLKGDKKENSDKEIRSEIDKLTSITETLKETLGKNGNQRKGNKDVITGYVEHDSFKLKGVENFQVYFEENGVVLTGILKELRKDFFDDSTTYQQFKDILSGGKIKSEKRISWKGSFKGLEIFVSLLNYNLKKIEPVKNGIWCTTCACFTKKGKEIEINQLSKARTTKIKEKILKETLEKILIKL